MSAIIDLSGQSPVVYRGVDSVDRFATHLIGSDHSVKLDTLTLAEVVDFIITDLRVPIMEKVSLGKTKYDRVKYLMSLIVAIEDSDLRALAVQNQEKISLLEVRMAQGWTHLILDAASGAYVYKRFAPYECIVRSSKCNVVRFNLELFADFAVPLDLNTRIEHTQVVQIRDKKFDLIGDAKSLFGYNQKIGGVMVSHIGDRCDLALCLKVKTLTKEFQKLDPNYVSIAKIAIAAGYKDLVFNTDLREVRFE